MLRCLKVVGAGFDCASQQEMEQVIGCGATPDDIILANPNKQISDILFAKRVGVEVTVFDREEELLKMKEYYPDAKLLLRVRTDPHNSVIPNPFTRFGANVEYCRHLLRKAKQNRLKVVGLSFHVGTHCTDPTAYNKALGDCKIVFDYAVEIGIGLSTLDLGGGFPGTDDGGCIMTEFASCIQSYLNELFPNAKDGGLCIIAEPGRYFSTASFTVVTNVISKSEPFGDEDVEVEYAVNDGKYGSFSQVGVPGEFEPSCIGTKTREARISRVWGGTCSTSDYLIEKQSLPEMQVGEWLLWKNAGTYSFALSSNFNGIRAEKMYDIITSEHSDLFYRLCGNMQLNTCG